jgi:hypothetical protein
MGQLTFLDVIKTQNPDGSMDKWIDPLKVEHKIFLNMPAVPCNYGKVFTGDRIVAKASATEYAYGLGTAPTKDSLEVVTDTTEGLESTLETDVRIIENEIGAAARYSTEEQRRLETLFETASSRIFNGNPATDPLQITGLYNRTEFSAIGTYVYDNAKGNGSITANKTSIWGIQQGEGKCHLIYPTTVSKVVRRDFTNKFEKTDDAGNTYPCQKTRWNLDFGLFIHDLRSVFRVANISCSATPNGTTEVSFDEDLLIEAIMKMPNSGDGCVLYANNSLIIQMTQRANKMPNSFCNFTPGQEMGFPIQGKILSFFNKPVLREDTITITEGLIS